MKISLAHDSFTQIGGAERLIAAAAELYPDSTVYTLAVDKRLRSEFRGWNFRASLLQSIYNVYPHLQYLFPFVPFALRFLKVAPTDVLFSFSSSYIKGLAKPAGSLHINYCHTPTRFIWTDSKYAEKEIPLLLRPLARAYFRWLRKWDLRAANKVDLFIANSREVQKRIKTFYQRDSTVIYPFADVNFWKPTRAKQNYFLLAGRLQPHKNNEAVVKLFNKLGLELHVVGTGRQETYLRSIAKPNTQFLGRVPDEVLRDEYSGALAFIYPPFEDFGMMAIEAASCGTATIGLGKAGILETVIPGKTGELFTEPTEAAIASIIQQWDAGKYSGNELRRHAEKFSKEIFQKQIAEFVKGAYENRH
jgi:glycosyltransferase involved in cell wall biosynthesis